MSFLSLFRKPTPEETAQSIVDKLVRASLLYRNELAHSDRSQSAAAGIETAYLVLHLLDREIFARFGESRDILFDPIAQTVIASYAKATLPPETPESVVFGEAKGMQDTLNSRQLTYAKCRSLYGDQFPSTGTMIFAFCFFVHRALGKTNRFNVDEILAGEKKMSESDRKDFPDIESILRGAAWIGSILKSVRIQKDAKDLR